MKSIIPFTILVLVVCVLAACTSPAPIATVTPSRLPGLIAVTATSISVPSPTKAPATAILTASTPTPRMLFASPSKPPLNWAQLMVQNVRFSNTSYQHKDDVVTWAGVDGASDYQSYADCSGFMNVLFTQAYELRPDDLSRWLGSRRPLAKDYFATIENERGMLPISNIANVQLGDLIVIRYLNSAPGDNTGHVLLVAGLPQRRAATKPVMNNTQQWDVVIIDSSETGHGKEDTRRLPNGTFHDGVGRGTMRIYTDDNGALVGYTWSDLEESLFYDSTARPLVIGRPDPKFSLP